MTFFTDMKTAIEDYPSTGLDLSIVDLAVQAPGTGPAINTREIWAFQVRIANHGFLNLTELQLHVTGLNDVLVSTSATGPWSSGLYFGSLTVNAGSTQDTVNLFFKAPASSKPAGSDLVNAHVNDFKVNLNHLLNDFGSHSTSPAAVYSAQVYPS